ncbi:hypothetical protein GCM10010193_70340 [Kitasatospora atroaurantiaca]|uniref:Uncharacterized protein n=1 Tax=Kitasatospora atroaurantiaca TaxID=285545 RepID=A0A561ENC3_9ACTN|nr:hypothetical protein [Kitasatospora atroaurantiaca]TWE17121.1 hypothetical protein FB465_2126 [Kitasatospora atroaurantiaca]
MSDENERFLHDLMIHIAVVFEALRTACAHLPVPIALADDLDTDVTATLMAVTRVIEISDEQPMPELRQAQLCTGALHWIAAVDLAALGAHMEGDIRLLASRINLHHAETALLDLAFWLAETE